MKLFFLRHAEAAPGWDDAARELTSRGHDQCRALGGFLQQAGVGFDTAYTSPLVRARQTAEEILQHTGAEPTCQLQVTDKLLNSASASEFAAWLRCLPDARSILLVGHNPSLSEHVQRLLTMEEPATLDLSKAGLVCVRTSDAQTGTLKYYLTSRLLGV